MSTIEQVHEYWNRRPCNLRHSPRPVGTREYFDEVEARKYFVEPHIPHFAEFERWKGKRVLEIGCGLGTDTMNFARAGALVTAVDLTEQSLALARLRASVYGLDIQFYLANAEELTSVVSVEPYDLVYSFGVIHHTPNPRRAVEHVIRLLKPGGEFRVMIYNRWSYKVLSICLRGLLRGRADFTTLIRQESEAQFGSPVTYVYDAEETRQLLSGLEIERMWVDHIFPYRIKEYVQYHYRKNPWFQLMPQAFYRWLCHRIGWHRLVIARKTA